MMILYWMTPDPVVATEEQTLLDVRRLMVERGIRRLPVVRNGDELCGMIGRSNLYRWVPPAELFHTLSPESRTALQERLVGDVMTRNPKTCDAHDPIEVLCARMAREKLGAYPVLLRGHLVGIISESDLLRAVAELAHLDRGGRRITLRIGDDESDGLLYQIVDLSRRANLQLLAVLTHPVLDESATLATLRVKGDGVDRFVRTLWERGFRVIDVSGPPGECPPAKTPDRARDGED